MKVEIVGREYYVDEKLKNLILKKLKRLDKYFGEDVKAKMTLSQDPDYYYMDIMIHAGKGIRAEAKSENMFDNIDLLIPRITKQFRKEHTQDNPKQREFADEKAGFIRDLEEVDEIE